MGPNTVQYLNKWFTSYSANKQEQNIALLLTGQVKLGDLDEV